MYALSRHHTAPRGHVVQRWPADQDVYILGREGAIDLAQPNGRRADLQRSGRCDPGL